MLLHVGLPLSPVVLGGFVRLVAYPALNWDTFSASELAICLTMLSVFVNQSLSANRLLDFEGIADEAFGWAAMFSISALSFTVLFAIITLIPALTAQFPVVQNELTQRLHWFEEAVFGGTVPVLFMTILSQRKFRLRAAIL
jgi:hypothetical protein